MEDDLGLSLSFEYFHLRRLLSCQLTPMYGPPDEMARDTTRRLQETALVPVCHRHSHCGEYCELSCRMETVTGPSQKRMIRWIPDVYRDGR